MAIFINDICCRAHVSFQIYLERTTIKVLLWKAQALEHIFFFLHHSQLVFYNLSKTSQGTQI